MFRKFNNKKIFKAIDNDDIDFVVNNFLKYEYKQKTISRFENPTPLMYICRLNKLEMLNRVLEHNYVDINVKTDYTTALMLAVSNDNVEMVRVLLNNGADTKNTLLYIEGVEITKMLLRAGANPNYQSFLGLPLMRLVKYRSNLELLKALLEGGANPNRRVDNWYPLEYILTFDNPVADAVADVLIDNGADIRKMRYLEGKYRAKVINYIAKKKERDDKKYQQQQTNKYKYDITKNPQMIDDVFNTIDMLTDCVGEKQLAIKIYKMKIQLENM